MTDMDGAIVLWLLKPPYAYTANLFPLTRRAVHITEVTKSHLQGDFICQTADADEIAQDEVLNGLTTYLIWPKDQVRPANRLNISTEVGNYHVAQWNCALRHAIVTLPPPLLLPCTACWLLLSSAREA